jgi:hypothetical protein
MDVLGLIVVLGAHHGDRRWVSASRFILANTTWFSTPPDPIIDSVTVNRPRF